MGDDELNRMEADADTPGHPLLERYVIVLERYVIALVAEVRRLQDRVAELESALDPFCIDE